MTNKLNNRDEIEEGIDVHTFVIQTALWTREREKARSYLKSWRCRLLIVTNKSAPLSSDSLLLCLWLL